MGLLSVAKLALYGIFLNYYTYYTVTGKFIPYGTALFFAVSFVCVLCSMWRDRLVNIGYEIRCWLLYIALSLASVGFAVNSGQAVDGIFKYAQRLIIIIMIVYICEKEGSVKFALRLLAVNAVCSAFAILYVTDDIQLKLSITSGANLSANDIGALMAFGCFAVMFAFGRRNKTSLFIPAMKYASVIAMISVIFLAGSRKSIIAVIILAVLLVLLNGLEYIKNAPVGKLFVALILGAAAFVFVSSVLAPYASETNLYTRLFGRGAEGAIESDDGRISLYVTAIKDFLHHPFVGLGFSNFQVLHGVYSHSTYVEPLACSGIIGLLYLIPYVRILKRQFDLVFISRGDAEEYAWQKGMLAFYIMFLFIGVGIPYMYKDNPCIILAMLIASQSIAYKKHTKNV